MHLRIRRPSSFRFETGYRGRLPRRAAGECGSVMESGATPRAGFLSLGSGSLRRRRRPRLRRGFPGRRTGQRTSLEPRPFPRPVSGDRPQVSCGQVLHVLPPPHAGHPPRLHPGTQEVCSFASLMAPFSPSRSRNKGPRAAGTGEAVSKAPSSN